MTAVDDRRTATLDSSTDPVLAAAVDEVLDYPLAIDDPAADVLFRSARTANAFDGRPVSDEQLTALHDLAKFGPTAMNIQPLRITYFRSEEAKGRLLPFIAPHNQPKSASASVVAVLSADRDFHEHLPVVFPHKPDARENFDGVDKEDARWGMATFNATLQAGYFVIAARAVGLTAGPMGGFDADGLSAELFPNGDQRAFLVVNLGYPADNAWFDRLPRLQHDQVATIL